MSNHPKRLLAKRQALIKQILEEQFIDTYLKLSKALERKGVKATVVTLSRDLNQMKVVKVNTEEGVRYVLSTNPLYKRVYQALPPKTEVSTLKPQGFISLHYVKPMAVIHTLGGYAGALCKAIDEAKVPGILGTIAGYDTIFLVLTANTTEDELKKSLSFLTT